ncbi:MAG: hypothetical protein JSS86_14300 [Cyanobacteria bacterium SZAS LIN-2]|nr:hypothetical protein [Cyanobacteria bacterium SZAS LIN-2]MBS2010946.1 hypothetical protein [Cyanobacteria bacterium SZAS TMP-1]
MHDLIRILAPAALIVVLAWLISTAGSVIPGNKPGKDKELFKKILFWCLLVPVVGTTVGTLILLGLKSLGWI